MVEKSKLGKVYRRSIEVIKACSLKNGAIVASNILDEAYPKDVKSYFYVWPRDASFVCYAADLLGLHEIPERFFEWCWKRAELFREKGVFLAQKYYPHGRAAGDFDIGIKISDLKNEKLRRIAKNKMVVRLFYMHFQPDQTASLLWAIHEHSKFRKVNKFHDMVKKAANGLCKLWNEKCFKIPSFDLWEEKVANPKLEQVHTYSLAMCIKGLKSAAELIKPKRKWLNCIEAMEKALEKCYLSYFVKTYGKKIDRTIDSSALGLVWPAEVIEAKDKRMVLTVKKILEKNEINGGILRYPKDRYDGKISFGKLKLGGAGAWPLLNFWTSIYFLKAGKRKEALKYFNWVLERIDDKIPEQIKNDKPASIIPLAWGHAMFIIASKFLSFAKI